MLGGGGTSRGFASSDRGVSSVVGLTLMLGFSIMVVSAVILLGSAAISDVQSEAESEQAESALQQFDSTATQVALGDSDVQTTELGLGSRGGEVRTGTTGRITVRADDGTVFVNQTMGTLYYESDDRVVAYQGGGVWRGTGNDSRMVSPPEFHYRDGTLTLPITVLNPTESGNGNRVTVTANGSSHGIGPGTVERQMVTVEVTSQYYLSWARYFENRIDGANVRIDHPNETVALDLARQELDGDFETGLVATGDVDAHTSGTFETTIDAGGSVDLQGGTTLTCDAGSGSDCYTEHDPQDLSSLDSAIETMVENSEDDDPAPGISGGTTLDDGSYYSDGFELGSGDLTLDIADGNVTLFVDGNIGLSGQKIRVVGGSGTNHHARIYTTGDFAAANGNAGVSVDTDNATRFQLYGTSELHFGMGQGDGYTGTVYAPRESPASGSNQAVAEYGLTSATSACSSTVDVCLGQGNFDVNGAIIAGPTSIAQATSFEYDDELEHLSPELPSGEALPPSITHLHVSANRIDVAGAENASGSLDLPGPRVIADLEITEQAGGDEYELSAGGTAEASEVDEYRWDYENDSSIDETTTNPVITVECDPAAGGDIDCTNLPDEANVTAVNDDGHDDFETAEYPGGGGGGGSNPPTIDSFTVTDNSRCTGGGSCNGQDYAEFDISWAVTDDDGDLDQVTVEVEDTAGNTRESYSAYSASETYHEDGSFGDAYVIRVTAEDDEGHSVCAEVSDPDANDDSTDQTDVTC